MMNKQTRQKAKDRLCKMCKNECKDMYKYGDRYVKQGCYYKKAEERTQ